eukprot:3194237-Pleurochrysis_carterae.AAC.5
MRGTRSRTLVHEHGFGLRPWGAKSLISIVHATSYHSVFPNTPAATHESYPAFGSSIGASLLRVNLLFTHSSQAPVSEFTCTPLSSCTLHRPALADVSERSCCRTASTETVSESAHVDVRARVTARVQALGRVCASARVRVGACENAVWATHVSEWQSDDVAWESGCTQMRRDEAQARAATGRRRGENGCRRRQEAKASKLVGKE